MTNNHGNGGEEQGATSSIDAEESMQDQYHYFSFHWD